MPKGFFELPRELRNNIYDELWSASYVPGARNRPHWPVRMSYDYPGFPALHNFPVMSWLTANKAMLREGQEQFHLRGSVLVHFIRHADQTPFDIQETPRLLSPRVARDLSLRIWAEVHDADTDSGKQFVSIEANVLKQVKDMITGNGHLRKLDIRVTIEGLEEGKEHEMHFEELLASVAAVAGVLHTFKLVLNNRPAQYQRQREPMRHLIKQLKNVKVENMVKVEGSEERGINPLEVVWKRVS